MKCLSFFIVLAILVALPGTAVAQASTGSVHGQVTDPSGAVVTNATVTVTGPDGPVHSATTNHGGNFEVGNLAPGKYTVTANAKGFATFTQINVEVAASPVEFNIPLDIQVEQQKVEVQDDS